MSIKHKDYTFTLSENDTNPLIPHLEQAGQLHFTKEALSIFNRLGTSPQEEENIHKSYDLYETQTLARTRTVCHDDIQAIVDLVLQDNYLIHKDLGRNTQENRLVFPKNTRSKVLDVGPGASGYMVKNFLNKYIKKEDLCTQMDINPHIVEKLKKEVPKGSRVREGSLLRGEDMGKNNDIITSLSSLDVTQYLELAIENISNALKPGGYLFSLQDVRPGMGIQRQGLSFFPFPLKDITPGILPNSNNMNIIACYKLPNGTLTTVMELFKIKLGAALVESGSFDIHVHHFIHAATASGKENGRIYYANMLAGLPEPINQAYAIATLAQKKEPKMIFIMPEASKK